MTTKDIVAIGGSMGSGAVLKTLMRELPSDLPASIFITTHVPATTASHLVDMLQSETDLPVVRVVDGQPIERGRIYVAAQDRHLLLLNGTIRLGAGPRENLVRPAIDPMFRSAALSYGTRAVGVVLTGLMSDGAAGLHAIKACGGTAVVQHPLDAEADEMPRAALEAVEADYVARGDELADLIGEVIRTPAAETQVPPSRDLLLEVEVAAGARLGSDELRRIATPSTLTCPECHGVLSEVNGARPLRYRCQIGHAYTAEVLVRQSDQVNEAVRVAMRVMEERVELVSRMARDARQTGRTAVAELYEQRAEEYGRYARTLREAALLSISMGHGGEDDLE